MSMLLALAVAAGNSLPTDDLAVEVPLDVAPYVLERHDLAALIGVSGAFLFGIGQRLTSARQQCRPHYDRRPSHAAIVPSPT